MATATKYATASPLLAAQFDSSSGTTEPGFTPVQSSTPVVISGYTVAVTGEENFFNRGVLSDSTPYGDLYDGFAYINGGPGPTSPIDISIKNVLPGVPYSVTLFSYDYGNFNPPSGVSVSAQTTFSPEPSTATLGQSGSVSFQNPPTTANPTEYTNPAPDSDLEYETKITLVSTSTELDIQAIASPAPNAIG